MKEVYFQIIRNFDGISEKDIYSDNIRQRGWVDLTEFESCWEDRTDVNFATLEEAKKIFNSVKDDKTEWTKSIQLVKVTENYDDDGEFIDENREVING